MKEKIYIPIRISEEILTDEIAKKLAENKDKKILLEILDEDFTSINIKKQEEILIQINKVLKEYKGTVLFVSHDRFFINAIANRVLNIENYKIKSYYGNYDDFTMKNII